MSDFEDEFEYESDASDGMYGGDDSGGECNAGGGKSRREMSIAVENAFYEADDRRQSDPEGAVDAFQNVLSLIKECEEAGFTLGTDVNYKLSSLQYRVVLLHRLGRHEEMHHEYSLLLQEMSSEKVVRNDAADAINNILDAVSPSGHSSLSSSASRVFEMSLSALQASGNRRLWCSVCGRLARLYRNQGDWGKVGELAEALHSECRTEDGKDDMEKGSQLLEAYALKIQAASHSGNLQVLKSLFPKTMQLTTAIADPRNVAVIRESGGRMFMQERRWSEAYNEFFEAFKHHQETGNAEHARRVLKKTSKMKIYSFLFRYVVLANLLSGSTISPFDSREAKVYQEDVEVAAMVKLRAAFEKGDMQSMERLMHEPRNNIVSDSFIGSFTSLLRTNVQLRVLMESVGPYKRVKLKYLADRLSLEGEEGVDTVTRLLIRLIHEGKILRNAKIDFTKKILVLEEEEGGEGGEEEVPVPEPSEHELLVRWSSSLLGLHSSSLSHFSLNIRGVMKERERGERETPPVRGRGGGWGEVEAAMGGGMDVEMLCKRDVNRVV